MEINSESKLKTFLTNKYVLTLLALLVWMLFFDENNLVRRFEMDRQIKALEKEAEEYKRRIAEDSLKIEKMNMDDEELEKFARENYYMSRPDEDIFIIE